MTAPPDCLTDPPEMGSRGPGVSFGEIAPVAVPAGGDLLEQALGERQAGEVLWRQPLVGFDAEALEHVNLWAPLASLARRDRGRIDFPVVYRFAQFQSDFFDSLSSLGDIDSINAIFTAACISHDN